MTIINSIRALCVVATLICCSIPWAALAVSDIPASSVTIPPMVPEQSVSTYVPSEAAPGEGLAVNVIYPKKARYGDGAPVVVVVSGGHSPSGLEFSMHAAQAGFVEVRFAFPGGGKPGFVSSGINDSRGVKSQEALRDILLFAGGKLADSQGRNINELVPVKTYNKTVGVVGWSNGGNIAAVTLGKFGEQLPFIGWLAFYESPLGALFYPPALGGVNDLILNRHYREGSCATGKCLVDYRKLRWQSKGQKAPGAHKKQGEPELPGVLFFDENKNGAWEEAFEYALTYSTDVGYDKQIYPPQITLAADRLNVFGFKKRKPSEKAVAKEEKARGLQKLLKREPVLQSEKPADNEEPEPPPEKDWSKHVAKLAESEAYFQERDGSLFIPDIAQKLPNCAVIVIGTRVDHLQRQPDHPHIALQYNAWLHNKTRWVRLNPDPVYVNQVSGLHSHSFADNKPNMSIDATELPNYLEHEGMLPDYVFAEAAIAELSDRKKAGKLGATLTAPVVAYSNGAAPPPEQSKPVTRPTPAKQPAKAKPATKTR